jgi:N-acetylglutamate synthase-like GNAT family acetyltransferase
LNVKVNVRPACKKDAEQMLTVYDSFVRQFVGSVTRTAESFQRVLKRKDNVIFVAVDSKDRIIGYVSTRLEKSRRRAEFRELIVDPKHDFVQVAKPLVEKAQSLFIEKNASAIYAASIRNPWFEKLFPDHGFFESETSGVFMYAVLDAPKLLSEISPVFVNRLRQIENWNGLVQLECEGNSIFLCKTCEEAKQIIQANEPVSLKVELNVALLIRLIFGVSNCIKSLRSGEMKIKTSLDERSVTRILKQLFPQRQFLIMDYW